MTESLLSCYTCGFEDPFAFENSPVMQKRASISRETDHRHGSIVRARSEERLLSSQHDQVKDLQEQLEELALKTNDTMDSDDGILDDDHQNGDIDAAEQVRKALEEAEKEDTKEEDDEFHDAVQGDNNNTAEKPYLHRRAMSDPFDTPLSDREMDEIRQVEEAAVAQEEELQKLQPSPKKPAYPTMPRYPVAATRDKNCWSEAPVSIFSVRGPNYLSDKKKVPSKDYLFRARGVDLFLFEGDIDLNTRSTQILNGHLRSLPTLSINFKFPWGAMMMYYEIPNRLAKYVGETSNNGETKIPVDADLPPSERLLANWLQGDTEFKNERLKLIAYVAEGPWVVRNMVTGRPAIIGKKLPVSYTSLPADPASNLAPLLQCTLDIGSSSATAKRIVSVCRRYMSALTVDIGFVIQGETPAELPEQMMGATRVHGADPLKAPKL